MAGARPRTAGSYRRRKPGRPRDEERPDVAEAEPEDVVRGADWRYLDRSELRRRLIEALG